LSQHGRSNLVYKETCFPLSLKVIMCVCAHLHMVIDRSPLTGPNREKPRRKGELVVRGERERKWWVEVISHGKTSLLWQRWDQERSMDPWGGHHPGVLYSRTWSRKLEISSNQHWWVPQLIRSNWYIGYDHLGIESHSAFLIFGWVCM